MNKDDGFWTKPGHMKPPLKIVTSGKTSPECKCAVGSVCQHNQCCYYQQQVPDNVRSTLRPLPTEPAALDTLRRKVAYAQERLRKATQRAELTGDPYRDLIEAQTESLDVYLDLAGFMDGLRKQTPAGIDPQEVSRALKRQAPTFVAAAVEERAQSRSWRIVLVLGGLLLAFGAGWSGHSMRATAECAANGIAGHANGLPYCVIIRWL